jgi:SpoVK/Ycf46/Vps4 family AAA+-type ATPase
MSCKHSRTTPTSRVRASQLFPDDQAFEAKRLFFEARSMGRCDCGAITQGVPTDLPVLQDTLRSAAKLIRNGSETVTLKLGDGTTALRPDVKHEGESEVTAVTFEATSPRFRLADVVLPASTENELSEALIKIRHHDLIYKQWGFERADPSGRGARLNLYGPPGTGKSRTAEAIAGELGQKFLSLTVADIEDRYLGETAKRIQAAFRAAAESNAVLFFDEADSLFGRRASDVTQGADNEINAAKSTLLVEVDRFEGVLILATNFQQNFDSAFVRRISNHVRFRLPDGPARRRLWDYHLTEGIPLAEERPQLIEHLMETSEGLSGGDILTILRLSLPRAIRQDPANPRLDRTMLADAIGRVRAAISEVGGRSKPQAALPWTPRSTPSDSIPERPPVTRQSSVSADPATQEPSKD